MASISSISNTESGNSVRTKLNATIVEANKVDNKLDTSKLNGGGARQSLKKITAVDQEYDWQDDNIIANKGVGLAASKPVTGLTVGDIYVSTDTFLKFTATGTTTWDAGVALISGVFINNTFPTENLLYQYNGTVVKLTGDGIGGGSNGHIIQDSVDGAAETTYTSRTYLRWLSKNGISFVTDLGAIEDAIAIELKIEGMNDLDVTGKAAEDLVAVNATNNGYKHVASEIYDGIVPPSPEAGLTGADATNILIVSEWLAAHTVGCWVENETANVITGFKITDGTNDLFTAFDLAANASKYVEFDMSYADKLNDIPLYIYATTWNSGTVTITLTQIKH